MIENLTKNTLSSEEANKLVTYGELLTIFQPVIGDIVRGSAQYSDTLQNQMFDVIHKLADSIVEMRNLIDYKRQRDARFMMGMIAQFHNCDVEVIHKEYQRWCAEFDKLNMPNKEEEKKDE